MKQQTNHWHVRLITDPQVLLDYLETDRGYTAYAIGDLEPDLFAQCTWHGAETNDHLQALTLCFTGFKPPILVLVGDPDGLSAILDNDQHPEQAYITCRPGHLALVRRHYTWENPIAMWRMMLQSEAFEPIAEPAQRLGPEHAEQLQALFAMGPPNAFHPRQLDGGVFYGRFKDGQVIAVAGTHLVSYSYRVAAVGDVLTHPDQRRQGHATAVTNAVVAELLRQGIQDIVLNVKQANTGAIRIYERLGFAIHCPFLEGTITHHSNQRY